MSVSRAASLSSSRYPAGHALATRRNARRGRWALACLALLLALLAPALVIATEQGYPLPHAGIIPLIGGWLGAGICAFLAIACAIRALATLPPRPAGRFTSGLAGSSLMLGGLGLLVWVGLSLYAGFFLLLVPVLLVALS